MRRSGIVGIWLEWLLVLLVIVVFAFVLLVQFTVDCLRALLRPR